MLPIVKIFGLSIQSYTLFNLIGGSTAAFIAGIILMLHKKYKLWEALITYVCALALVLVGGRICSYIIYYRQYVAAKIPIYVWKPTGIETIAGVMLALVGLYATARLLKKSYLGLLDIFCISQCFSICVAKIGCFLTGCCGGIQTHLPWGVIFPATSVPVHPTQLYESLFGLILGLFLLHKYMNKNYNKDGLVFEIFMFNYMFFRTVMYFLRAMPYGATHTSLVPIFMFTLGLIFLITYYSNKNTVQPQKVRRHKNEKKK